MGFRKIVFRNVELLIARDADYMGNILVQEELATKLKHVSPGLGIYKPDELHL